MKNIRLILQKSPRATLYLGIVLTVLFGILLRLQFAGFDILNTRFDWYRVHTHLGYYMVLMPAIFIFSLSQKKIWSRLYWWVAIITLMTFFFQGYSVLAKILSGIVVSFWFVGLNSKKPQDTNIWSLIPKYGLYLSTVFLALVIVLPKFSNEWEPSQLAKGFLSTLLIGVIIPHAISLTVKSEKMLSCYLYLISSFCYSLYIIHILPAPIAVLSSLLMIFCLIGPRMHLKMPSFWVLVFLGLLIHPFIPKNLVYQTTISGLHFIFLGPVLMSLFSELFKRNGLIYFLSVAIFSTLIFSLALWPSYFSQINAYIALCGGLILTLLVFAIYRAVNASNVQTTT